MRVCITGASSGIGYACAELFAQHNVKLLLIARSHEKLAKLAEKLREKHQADVHCVALDVRKSAEVIEKLQNLPAEWQALDVLVNNAGLALALDKIQEGDIQQWEQMIDTNVKGLLFVTRQVLPGMLERKKGHIVNIGSTAGHGMYPGGVVYCATKHAVRAISEGLKMDLHGTPIRVSSVDPGLVETNFSRVRFAGDEARAKAVYAKMTPLDPKDIADAVYYCVSRPSHVNVRELIITPTDQSSVQMVYRHE